MSKLLEGKVAVIYGGGGAIGGGVARTFAREGARVFLAGRTEDTLEAVAKHIAKSLESRSVRRVENWSLSRRPWGQRPRVGRAPSRGWRPAALKRAVSTL